MGLFFNMTNIKFSVQGSAIDPYIVTFIKDKNKFNAFCTCSSGENGQYCKHRIAILSGDAQAIVSDNKNQVSEVCSLMLDTDLERALIEFLKANNEYDAAKTRLAHVKKKLAEAMRK